VGKHLNSYIATQFQQLFKTTPSMHVEEVLDCVQQHITQEMNDDLSKPFSGEEVWEALQDMEDLKAPGVDGFQ
jgi:hypothetical protein